MNLFLAAWGQKCIKSSIIVPWWTLCIMHISTLGHKYFLCINKVSKCLLVCILIFGPLCSGIWYSVKKRLERYIKNTCGLSLRVAWPCPAASPIWDQQVLMMKNAAARHATLRWKRLEFDQRPILASTEALSTKAFLNKLQQCMNSLQKVYYFMMAGDMPLFLNKYAAPNKGTGWKKLGNIKKVTWLR